MKMTRLTKGLLLALGAITLIGTYAPDAHAQNYSRDAYSVEVRQRNFDEQQQKQYQDWLNANPNASYRQRQSMMIRMDQQRDSFLQKEAARFPHIYQNGNYNNYSRYNYRYQPSYNQNRYYSNPYHYSSYDPYSTNNPGALTPFQQNSPFFDYLQNTLFGNY